MNSHEKSIAGTRFRPFLAIILAITSLLTLATGSMGQPTGRSFASPNDAVQALLAAVQSNNEQEIAGILGPSLEEWIRSGDPVADANTRSDFVNAAMKKKALEGEETGRAVLLIGDDGFPFPIPIVKSGSEWRFDPEAGKQEIIDRRVGKNELTTIQVLLAIVDAQAEYVEINRGKNRPAEYAKTFISSEGKTDGLYWPERKGRPKSPLGPLVAAAEQVGYSATARARGGPPVPLNGYYYRMLYAQGPAARGGTYSYLVDGRLIGGFAVLAWPAKYRASGYKTFMVNHDGIVYETDLGVETAKTASSMKSFNPNDRWKPASHE